MEISSCEELIDALLEKRISVDEAEEILKANKDLLLNRIYKRTYRRKCFFCGATSCGTRRIVLCENCGISLSSFFEIHLTNLGIDADEVRQMLLPYRKQLVEFMIKYGQCAGVSFAAKVVAYNYYKLRDYKKAREIISNLGKHARKALRRAVEAVFGKNLCLNDCMINLFIEKAEELGISADAIDEGVRILKRVGERTSLTRTIVAAVAYLVSEVKQSDIERAFGVSSMAVRTCIKQYKLVHELFVEKARKYGLDEVKVARGLEMLDSIGSPDAIDAAAVFRLVAGASAEKVARMFCVSTYSVRKKCEEMEELSSV
jgi:hypothetical protein